MSVRSSNNNKIKNFLLHILCCCDRSEPSLQIGHPTEFRREDISLPGLTEVEQAFIREKAMADAQRMVAAQAYPIPSPRPDQFTMPHHSPAMPQHQSTIERVRRHTRKLSAKMGFSEPLDDDEFASRPIVHPGEEDRYSDSELGIRGGVARESLLAAQSRDSITLGGGSENSFHFDIKDTLPRL